MRVYYDRDCDVNLIKDLNVAILGLRLTRPRTRAEPARSGREKPCCCPARRFAIIKQSRRRRPKDYGHRRSGGMG